MSEQPKIEEVKKIFIEYYESAGFKLVDQNHEGLFFSRGVGPSVWLANTEDIIEYAQLREESKDYKNSPNECCIISSNYREQALSSVDIVPTAWLIRLRTQQIVFGDPSSDRPYAIIGRASPLFVAYFRFDPKFSKLTLGRLIDPGRARRATMNLRERIINPPVIVVGNLKAGSVDEAVKISESIINGCLFQLAALKGIPQQIRNKWAPKKSLSATGFRPKVASDRDDVIPMLRSSPIGDLVNLYTLGSGTQYPPLKFLTYYQIMEYFFIKVADEMLYEKLSRRINDISFRCVPGKLDRVIQDVIDHRRENDETEMLKGVIEKFVGEDELIEFIKNFDNEAGPHYQKKRKVFGVDVNVSMTSGHVIGGVAKTIKVIRNALVHSSDRYQRQERYVPFSSSEELISNELPLMQFLAEKIIVATSQSG